MNIFLIEEQDINAKKQFLLENKKAEHIFKVLRLGVGDLLRIGVLNGGVGQAKIISLDKKQCLAQIIHLEDSLPKALNISLCLALPRPNMLRRILQHVTELGVKEIYLFNSKKVEKSFWQSPLLVQDNLEAAMKLGLEQSKDTRLPQLRIYKDYREFISQLNSIDQQQTKLIAHPYSIDEQVKACPSNLRTPVCLAIGPEGGFSNEEVDDFIEHGFAQVHMGERILRVENAVSALCARVANWGE